MQLAGTSFVTTAPAATIELSPIGGVGAYPDPLAKDDRGRVGVAPVLGSDAVVEGREDHVVPYLTAVPDYHSAVVLEMAAGIDEHILSYSDVLPEVSVQRREYLECRIYRRSSRTSSAS